MPKKYKFVCFTTEIFPKVGGIQKYNLLFANALAELNGEENVIVVPSTNDYDPGLEEYKFKFDFYRGIVGSGLFKIFNPLIRFVNVFFFLIKYRPSIVFISHVDQSLLLFLFAKLFFKKVSVLTYGYEVWNKLSFLKLGVLKSVDTVVTISEYTANKLQEKNVCADKVYILPVAVDLDVFKPEEKKTYLLRELEIKDEFVLLTVGRMDSTERYKGHDVAIEALSSVIKKYDKVKYLIVGDGDDVGRLKGMVKQFNLGKHVIFTGRVGEEELVEYYNLCDVYLMPNIIEEKNGRSVGEGFGIVFLEANACGKPCIAGNMGGSLEAIKDGYNGFIVNSLSREDITEKIIFLIENRNIAKQMGENGLVFVRSNFSKEVFRDKVKFLVNSLIIH